ncbi:MAG: nitroreductase family protein [Candidatus Heimdallarchaeota archaeon]|nr:nitroreductase family protein [Candidatus Heimdallarchaeota archaeon]
MNSTIDRLLNHRSIRKYINKPLEKDILDKLLEVGIRAPSSGNLQNYSLMILDDRKKLAIIGEETGAPFIIEASLCIIALVDFYRYKKLAEMFDAPFHFNSADSVFVGMWDAIIALHNIVVAAESLGLGTCYIGLILSTDNRKLLDLPDYVFAAGMISIGYPTNIPNLRTRLPLESLIHRNTYKKPTEEELKNHYQEFLSRWDNYHSKLSDDKKKHWNEDLGVCNNVQYINKTVYTKERIEEWSKKISENIRNAKFNI